MPFTKVFKKIGELNIAFSLLFVWLNLIAPFGFVINLFFLCSIWYHWQTNLLINQRNSQKSINYILGNLNVLFGLFLIINALFKIIKNSVNNGVILLNGLSVILGISILIFSFYTRNLHLKNI